MDESSEYSEQGSVTDEVIWKKNTRFFYSLLLSQQLEWPSMTIEWLDSGKEKDLAYVTHRLAYGTCTSSQDQEKLIVDAVGIPKDNAGKEEIDSMIEKNKFFSNIYRKDHLGEVNKIRHHPSSMMIIASKSSNGAIYICDYSKASKRTGESASFIQQDNLNLDKTPLQTVLTGHSDEGYGLDWNCFSGCNNLIASGSYDKKVCYWDVYGPNSQPISVFDKHVDKVEDVGWTGPHQIVSVSDDGQMVLTDIRCAAHTVLDKVHDACINSFECSKVDRELWLTSSSDRTAKVWDPRQLASPLWSLKHESEVLLARWAPFSDSFLATATLANKLPIWQVGKESPCFVHEGHFTRINDLAWNNNEQFVIASVDDDNYLQVWCMLPQYLNI